MAPKLVLVALVGVQGAAYAWDGVVAGTVSQFDSLPNAGNFDFRIYLSGQTGPWCGPTSAPGWAGLHSTEPNFKGVQASLMLAFAMGKPVTVYLTRDPNNYCKLGYVTVSN